MPPSRKPSKLHLRPTASPSPSAEASTPGSSGSEMTPAPNTPLTPGKRTASGLSGRGVTKAQARASPSPVEKNGESSGTRESESPGGSSTKTTSSTTTYIYPPSVPLFSTLPPREQQFKTARFIACSAEGCICAGLHPPMGAKVVVKEREGEEGYWGECGVCGHGWEEEEEGEEGVGGHYWGDEVGEEERRRRGRVAGRIEELLQDMNKLLEFSYTDPTITSLLNQMTPFSPPTRRSLSPSLAHLPPSKRIRIELSASPSPRPSGSPDASSASSSEDEGPLLNSTRGGPVSSRMPAGKTSRKGVGAGVGKGPRKGATSGKVPAKGSGREPIQIVERDGEEVIVDDSGEVIRKLHDEDEDDDMGDVGEEDAMEVDEPLIVEQQKREEEAKLVDKLTAGVSVDADMDGVAGISHVHMDEIEYSDNWENVRFERLTPRPAALEFEKDYIRLPVVSSSEPSSSASIVLIGCKNLFQRQLPKMPREYITRLVLDPKHYCMAIVKKGYRVVGGICYRPFESRGFAEIVFCAVESTEQIRGYGSYLMNAVKDYVRQAHPTIHHFLTYADNFAIGYFKKQGFTKEISLPRDKWVGYIKDYDSANLMMCKVLPRVKYLEVHQMLHDQKTAVLAKIQTISNSHVVRPGLEVFKGRKEGEEIKLRREEIPGLVESGWDPEIDEIIRAPRRKPQHIVMQQILSDLQNSGTEWAFGKPVDPKVVTDYYGVIKHPMDLSTMELKLDGNQYDELSDFINDVKLISANCKQYNGEKTTNTYTQAANKLEKALEGSLKKRIKDHGMLKE